MKKFFLAFALFVGVGSLYNNTIEAQSINISINIGRQPAWGPVGYDYVGYYYFPDIDIYYNVNSGIFYYPDRGRWVSVRYLPPRYRHYDLYGLYKVVLNVNDPWRYHHIHYRDYAKYKGYRKQLVIRDSRDMRYRDSRNNRVGWYYDSKQPKHRNDYKYNDQGRNKNYSDRNRYNNDGGRKEYRFDDKKNDKRNDRSENKDRRNYSNSRENSNRNNSRSRENNKNVRPSSNSNKSKEYRLVSNTGQNDRKKR